MTESFVPASETPPPERELWVATMNDGQQLMVERWFNPDGSVRTMTAALRPVADTHVVWGPPATLTRLR